MDKEKIITIVIGTVLGIVIAGGLFIYLRYTAKSAPETALTQQTPPQPTTQNSVLTIFSPEDNLITKDKTVEVKGTGPAKTKLLIFTSVEEKMITTDDSGNFGSTIKLEEGENKISVFYFGADQQLISVSRIVIVEI